MTDFIFDGPKDAPVFIVTHGSGAGMETPYMTAIAEKIASHDIRVARFEFEFMAQRRITGKKRPPPKAEKLIDHFSQVIDEIDASSVFIGGKSLGGRVASMLAQRAFDEQRIKGLVCLGYPFHPPGKPESLRTAHFENFNCPTLVCQGERDPFGKREEIETYDLPASMQFHWAPFGNHDQVPPKRSGITAEQNWDDVAKSVADFIKNQAL